MNLQKHKSTLVFFIVIAVVASGIAAIQVFHPQKEPNIELEMLRVKFSQETRPVVDHSKFSVLQQEFTSPQQVTKTCISCHNERHTEVMASAHWNWERIDYIDGRGLKSLGKKNVLNNFCIGVAGSEAACASCHTGFGLTDVHNFDFHNPENVDCLACHASSNVYEKSSNKSGLPAMSVNLQKAAVSVGRPNDHNCGSCHFYGGGGNNVKHGDLEEALYSADRTIDVHMAKDGIGMTCVDCHTAQNHEIKGRLYSVSSNNANRAYCEDCHSTTPHLTDMLNTHSAKVACQTCHIPEYAKVNPTKMTWKWSDAGKLDTAGKPFTLDDSTGEHVYMSLKGTFTWAKNVQPEYTWFNGRSDHYLLGDTIPAGKDVIAINTLFGSHHDPESKIIPVKIHRGDQIYDSKNRVLIQPKLYGTSAGDSAFWKDFDWKRAAEKGMADIGLPFSGEYGFIQTEMSWPLNHMVSKAENSLQCADCHTPQPQGRLASLTGFYLPGRDRNDTADSVGIGLILLSLLGVFTHASIRLYTTLRAKEPLVMQPYEEFQEDNEDEAQRS